MWTTDEHTDLNKNRSQTCERQSAEREDVSVKGCWVKDGQTEKLGALLTRNCCDSDKVNIFADITDHHLHHFSFKCFDGPNKPLFSEPTAALLLPVRPGSVAVEKKKPQQVYVALRAFKSFYFSALQNSQSRGVNIIHLKLWQVIFKTTFE